MEEAKKLAGKFRRALLMEFVMSDSEADFVVCEFDIKTDKFISMSKSSEKAWGYTPEEMIGKTYRDFIVKEDYEKSALAVETRAAKNKSLYRFRNRYRNKDGSITENIWYSSLPYDDVCLCFCNF